MLYMKILGCLMLTILFAMPLWGGEGVAATLALSGTTATVQDNGTVKTLSPEEVQVVQSRHAPFLFVAVGEEQAQQLGVPMGVHLFHRDGTPAGIIKSPEAEFCGEVYLSPDKKYLLMDTGTFVIRGGYLYSYPELTLLREEGVFYYNGDPVWLDSSRFVYTTVNTESTQRICGYDPCGPSSVSIFDVTTQQEKILKQGNDLCDYTVLRVENGNIDVGEYCLGSPQMWKERRHDSIPVKHLTVTP